MKRIISSLVLVSTLATSVNGNVVVDHVKAYRYAYGSTVAVVTLGGIDYLINDAKVLNTIAPLTGNGAKATVRYIKANKVRAAVIAAIVASGGVVAWDCRRDGSFLKSFGSHGPKTKKEAAIKELEVLRAKRQTKTVKAKIAKLDAEVAAEEAPAKKEAK